MASIVQYETRSGQPFLAGKHVLTPFSQVLHIQIPGFPGGLIWNRPVSVLVQDATGSEEVLPIHDVSRTVQWSLLVAGLFSMLFMWLIMGRIKRGK